MLSRFSRVRLYATRWTAVHQTPLSTGFSRQEYWSGLSFPFPMHACMLSRFNPVQLCVTLWTAAHQALMSMGFSRQEYWSRLPFLSPGDLPNQGSNLRPLCLLHRQADSLLSKPPGKLKNTEVGSLSLLQKIFTTQDLKRGLLHCRRILD